MIVLDKQGFRGGGTGGGVPGGVTGGVDVGKGAEGKVKSHVEPRDGGGPVESNILK